MEFVSVDWTVDKLAFEKDQKAAVQMVCCRVGLLADLMGPKMVHKLEKKLAAAKGLHWAYLMVLSWGI